MKEVYKLIGHALSGQIKELHLVEEINPDSYKYRVYTKWPNAPEYDGYVRIIGNLNDIDAIDFDCGPYLYVGYTDREDNYKVNNITFENDQLFVYLNPLERCIKCSLSESSA